MDADRGKRIVSAAKSLKGYRAADPYLAAHLHAVFLAGRAGLLAAAIRSHRLTLEKLITLAAAEGFSPLDLRQTLLPWLESAGLVEVDRMSDEVVSVRSIILNYENILTAVARLYESLDPTEADRGCLDVLKMVASLPCPESEVQQAVAAAHGEEVANLSITLCKSFKLVECRSGKGLAESYLYSSRLWASCINNAAPALSSLSTTDRAVLLEVVEQVRKYQGMPKKYLLEFARKHNAERVLNIAIGVQLLHETRIQMSSGSVRAFLTTPHFYEDMEQEHGEDVCDRVKIFLDSIRNGQHYGSLGTGRILNPERLINGLLTRGQIGPCTAIGTDYMTSEKAGIVKVVRSSPGSSRCYLELVQEDTVRKVYDVITKGTLDAATEMNATHVQDGMAFLSIEETAFSRGEVPEDVAEAERAIILQLREGG